MALDIQRLYQGGRAKTPNALWSNEEWDAVCLIERERGINRVSAGDFVRNGVLTLEDYDKAVKADFKPEKLDDVVQAATDELQTKGKKAVKGGKK